MADPQPPLPDSLTRHLRAPRDAVWPTPGDRHRYDPGAERPAVPSRAVRGVWLWALAYNLLGGAILVALWLSLGG